MSNRYNRPPESLRAIVFDQTGGACFYCEKTVATDLDHIVPYSYSQDNSERNLVPACGVCNAIAGNQHFESLQAKKEYILAERDTLHWRTKLERMVVTLVMPDTGMPAAEPAEDPKPKKKGKLVVTATEEEPPFKKWTPPAPGAPKTARRGKKALRTQQEALGDSQQPERGKDTMLETDPVLDDDDEDRYEPEDMSKEVEYLIDMVDDLTDDEADELMSALIGRDMVKMRPQATPGTYGRNSLGQVVRIGD